jgi:hypothetical protein
MKKLCLASACCIVLAACSHEPEPAAGAAGATKPQATAREVPTDSVAAVVSGAARAPVALRFTLAERPVVGKKLRVQLALSPTEPNVEVEVRAQGKDMTLEPGSEAAILSLKAPGEEVTHFVELWPQAAGLLDLEVRIKLTAADAQGESVYSIPLLSQAPGG